MHRQVQLIGGLFEFRDTGLHVLHGLLQAFDRFVQFFDADGLFLFEERMSSGCRSSKALFLPIGTNV